MSFDEAKQWYDGYDLIAHHQSGDRYYSMYSPKSVVEAMLFHEECIEHFKNYWDWSELSSNTDLKLNYYLIDKFIDLWDWSEIINRYYDDASLYTIDFLEKYVDRIPTNNLQNSYLWYSIVKRRMKELAFEIVSQ
jgi:hypothetical protein